MSKHTTPSMNAVPSSTDEALLTKLSRTAMQRAAGGRGLVSPPGPLQGGVDDLGLLFEVPLVSDEG